MLNSKVGLVPIARDYDEAYAILSDPLNYPHWSPVRNARFEQVGDSGYDWLVDLPRGPRILRYTPPNDFGVLDYTVLSTDGVVQTVTSLRLVRNGEGSQLVVALFQQPGISDAQFASDVEWALNDFRAIASVVERF